LQHQIRTGRSTVLSIGGAELIKNMPCPHFQGKDAIDRKMLANAKTKTNL
jgi:hypothetical protein